MEKGLKTDIFNYLLSIIVPGAVNFFSVPLLKWFLGAESYGRYALWYGAYLIVVAAAAGWLGMSIVRFKGEYASVNFFYRNLLRIVSWLAITTSVFSSIMVFFISKNLLFASLYGIAMFCHIFHVFIMSVSQANFKSRAIVYSEALRVMTFLCAYCVVLFAGTNMFLEKIFSSLILSYVVSFLVLKKSNSLSFRTVRTYKETEQTFSYKSFLGFGLPLVLWYLFSSIIPYSDKITVAARYGYAIQGNYQAIFDLMYRTVTVLFTAVTMATFPYLSKYYSEGNGDKIVQTIKRILLIEIALMIISLVIYLAGGGKLFLKLLGINGQDFYYIGATILVVAFIWQMAMMLQKPIELMKKTYILLINNLVALVVTLCTLGLILYYNLGFLLYPCGVLFGAIAYASLCFYQVKRALNKGHFITISPK